MREKEIYGLTIKENGEVYTKSGKLKKTYDNGRGYLIVALSINGKYTSKAIHRLLAEAFIPNPEGLSDVDHIDGNKRNNNLDNLRWCTHGSNIMYSYSNNRRSAVGESNARAYLTADAVKGICELLSQGLGPTEVSRITGWPYNRISSIKTRRNWVSISKNYKW